MIINSPEEWKAWLLWAGNPKTTALSLRWLSEAAHKMKHLCYFASLASKCQWLFHGVLLLLLLTKITYVSGERSHELLINRYYISRNCRSTMNLYPSKGKNSPNLSDASQILLSQPLLVVGFELQVVGGHFDLCYEPLSPWRWLTALCMTFAALCCLSYSILSSISSLSSLARADGISHSLDRNSPTFRAGRWRMCSYFMRS